MRFGMTYESKSFFLITYVLCTYGALYKKQSFWWPNEFQVCFAHQQSKKLFGFKTSFTFVNERSRASFVLNYWWIKNIIFDYLCALHIRCFAHLVLCTFGAYGTLQIWHTNNPKNFFDSKFPSISETKILPLFWCVFGVCKAHYMQIF